ncbi:OsmC family protein, partial [Paracoccus sp. PXZ]
EQKIKDDDIDVAATVGMESNGSGGFALTVALDVTIRGVDQATAEAIVAEAHKVCPYSNATRDNIDVTLSVKVQ